MARPLTVPVAGRPYRIMDAPEPLDGAADFQVDHEDAVIWLASHLRGRRRERAIAAGTALAWAERGGMIPLVQ